MIDRKADFMRAVRFERVSLQVSNRCPRCGSVKRAVLRHHEWQDDEPFGVAAQPHHAVRCGACHETYARPGALEAPP